MKGLSTLAWPVTDLQGARIILTPPDFFVFQTSGAAALGPQISSKNANLVFIEAPSLTIDTVIDTEIVNIVEQGHKVQGD